MLMYMINYINYNLYKKAVIISPAKKVSVSGTIRAPVIILCLIGLSAKVIAI
jgi:hypothetical protein